MNFFRYVNRLCKKNDKLVAEIDEMCTAGADRTTEKLF